MRRICLGLIGYVIFGLGLFNLSATSQYSGSFTDKNSANADAVHASWTTYPVANGTVLTIGCPSGVTGPCGYTKQTSIAAYSSVAPASGTPSDGWHNYVSTNSYSGTCSGFSYCNAQNYLNSLVVCTTNCSGTQNLSFSFGGAANFAEGGTGSNVNLFREPYNDGAYYLYTPDASTITITAPSGHYFSAFDFYWGSVDPWNSVTFNPSGNACDTTNLCTTVYGTDLSTSGFLITDTTHSSSNTPNTTSATIDFTPYCTTGQNPVCATNWKSISFSACNSSGVCYPAFEFDNLQFKLSSNATGGPISAPTPEPTSMLLLGSGIGSIGMLMRRKLRW